MIGMYDAEMTKEQIQQIAYDIVDAACEAGTVCSRERTVTISTDDLEGCIRDRLYPLMSGFVAQFPGSASAD